MLEIKNLKVKVGEKEILKGIDLKFELGKNYLLLGKNGSGKSSLVNFLMGNPSYKYVNGEVKLNFNDSVSDTKLQDLDLLKLTPDQRSRIGLFLSFQHIPEIEGIKLGEYLRIIYNIHLKNKNSETRDISPFIFKRFIQKYLEELKIPENFLDRDLNVGFSGGEKRKIEILQMKLIEPKYIILDEIDSGLDIDAFKVITKMIKKLSNENNTFIIITHQFKILDYVDVDKVFVMKGGKIVEEGGKKVIEKIGENGFET